MGTFDNWFNYSNLIHNLKYDAIESTVEITIVENPDTLEPQLTFVVTGISKLSVNRFHDPEEVTMGDCEKYTLKRDNEFYLHEIRTGDAIISFQSTGVFEEKS